MSWPASVKPTEPASLSPSIGCRSAHGLVGSQDRIYSNDGNSPLIDLVDAGARRILDVGCGAGDNAQLLKSRYPRCEVYGITRSAAEAELARTWMATCWTADIETELPPGVRALRFDVLIFSHVLEHLRDPAAVLQRFCSVLRDQGAALIAVPNALSWGMRWQFMRGDFEYRADGVLDDTHLRFFTYRTADSYLLGKNSELRLVSKSVTGSVPQWILRRYVVPRAWSERIDSLGCRLWPNLFGTQVLLKALRVGTARQTSAT